MKGEHDYPRGIGFLPIFNNFKIYEGLKFIAGGRKVRIQVIVLEAISQYYIGQTGQELNITNPATFHKQLDDMSKQQVAGGIANIIEKACALFIAEEFKKFSE